MSIVHSQDGTAIAYDKTGQGPALILVDGALCYRSFGPMKPLAALLEPHFTVFTYDRRGRGESGDTQPFAVEREIEDIDALIQAAGGSAFVYGASSGAALALRAAIHGLNITRLALFEPPLNDDPAAQAESRAYTAQLKDIVREGRRGDAVALFMSWVGTPEEAIAEMRQAPMWPLLEGVAPTLVYDVTVLDEGRIPVQQAAAVQAPTLLLTGSETIPFMHETARTLVAALPNAEHRVLEGQGHDAAAESVAPALIDFFTGGTEK